MAAMRGSDWFPAMWLPIFGVALMGAGLCSATGKRKRLRVLLIYLTGWGVLWLAACGGGSSSGGGTKSSGGTPAGAYTITVKATAGSIVHTTNVDLTVQ